MVERMEKMLTDSKHIEEAKILASILELGEERSKVIAYASICAVYQLFDTDRATEGMEGAEPKKSGSVEPKKESTYSSSGDVWGSNFDEVEEYEEEEIIEESGLQDNDGEEAFS